MTPPSPTSATPHAGSGALAPGDARARTWGRVALVGVLGWLSAPWLAEPALGVPDGTAFLHGLSLGMHETGHIAFAMFGETMTVLGGSLLQVLFPIAFVGHFAWRRQWYATAVCAWWVAQNGWDVAIYVADARAESLPLVGGGEHDWAWLLDRWELLHADHAVASALHHGSSVLALAALGAALLTARSDDEEG